MACRGVYYGYSRVGNVYDQARSPSLGGARRNPVAGRYLREGVQQAVQRQIDLLPEAYRIVLQLRDVEDYDTEEVAEMLNLTPVNVKIRLNRARAALK